MVLLHAIGELLVATMRNRLAQALTHCSRIGGMRIWCHSFGRLPSDNPRLVEAALRRFPITGFAQQ
jgi:hypothetical protein